jgi:hypothetical protein
MGYAIYVAIKEMVQNHSLTDFAKYLFCRDENVSQNEAVVEAICSVC